MVGFPYFVQPMGSPSRRPRAVPGRDVNQLPVMCVVTHAGQGSCHCWLSVPVQVSICSWAPDVSVMARADR